MRKMGWTVSCLLLLGAGETLGVHCASRAAAASSARPTATAAASVRAVAGTPKIDWPRVDHEAIEKFIVYLRVDTSNPRGNEDRAVAYFKKIFDAEGIPYKTSDSASGRGNIVARLKGEGHEPALILLNHMDVVPVDQRFWTVPGFSGLIKDGYVWGRGSEDMKDLGMAELMAFLLLHRNHVPLKRDVIFLGTADEEAGGNFGAGWVAKNRPEWYRGAGYLLTEGATSRSDASGNPIFYGVGFIEKTPAWVKLTATGRSGHGSIPIPDSATNRLVAALVKLERWQPPLELTPPMQRMFASLATYQPEPWRSRMEHIDQFLRQPDARKELARRPEWLALMTNTIAITQLSGSKKVNIIGPEATATLDCRILPGMTIERWVQQIREIIQDASIKINVMLNFPSTISGVDTPLYQSIQQAVHQVEPGAGVTLSAETGFTDSHFYRERGITAYGFEPFAVTEEDQRRVHGNDERLPVRTFTDGIRLMYEVVYDFSRQ
jgi:acetylornithine deacetylase/succinyl-diaminopimelate desuccinylase-like protein